MNNYPTLPELIGFAKFFAKFSGFDRNVSLSVEEEKAALDLLNKVAQNQQNFTQQHKDYYHALVEFAKADIERNDG